MIPPGGLRECSSIKMVCQKAQLYTNAHSMDKQDKVETLMHLENYDLVAIMETWWDDFHSWNTSVKGYHLFRRDRQGRKGWEVALYVKE